ncbi:MAG TPA: extracellular solute-binding protein [Polyangiaceae bacterium]|jgi:ABC-type Fe3+ transport system substrate-binding protein|nr:extracellular solute-binding protein [Polyangiaceae bacterium]
MRVGRYSFLAIFALLLFTPFLVRAWVGAPTSDAPPADLELRVITPHTLDIRRAFEAAFSDWHRRRFGRSVKIVYLIPQGTTDMVRYLRDAYGAEGVFSGAPAPDEQRVHVGIDVVWGGGDVTFEREIKAYLKPVNLPAGVLQAALPEPDLAGVALYDAKTPQAPRWVGVALSSFGIAYNPDLFKRLNRPAPQTWSDLTDPSLSGLLALADPMRSGSAAVAYMIVVQRAMADAEAAYHARLEASGETSNPQQLQSALAQGYHAGMSLLVRIAANARYFTESGSRPCDDVGQGDAAAAMAIDFYARVLAEELGDERVRYIAPAGASALTPDPVAVLFGTLGEREVLANRFVEFLLSADGQRLWNLRADASPYLKRSLRRLPIRRDVYRDRSQWADDTDPFASASGFNLRQEWMSSFRDSRDVWSAAWIENHDALRDAYTTILELSDAGLREQLIAKLSDLPIELTEILSYKQKRDELEKQGKEDSRLFQANQRAAWARRFREHFQEIGALAHSAMDTQGAVP